MTADRSGWVRLWAGRDGSYPGLSAVGGKAVGTYRHLAAAGKSGCPRSWKNYVGGSGFLWFATSQWTATKSSEGGGPGGISAVLSSYGLETLTIIEVRPVLSVVLWRPSRTKMVEELKS